METFGQKTGRLTFYKKESRMFFFDFCSPVPLGRLLFSNLECMSTEFSTPAVPAEFPVEKPGKNTVFHKGICAGHFARNLAFFCALCYNLNRRNWNIYQIRGGFNA